MTTTSIRELLQGRPDDMRRQLQTWLNTEMEISDQALAAAMLGGRYAQKLESVREYPDVVRHLLENPPAVPAGLLEIRQRPEYSNTELTGKAARSITEWVKGGMKYVDEAIREKRMQACLDCPHLMDGDSGKLVQKLVGAIARSKRVCSLCGCNVSAKGRFPHESCPASHPEKAGYTRWDEPVRSESST